SYAALPQVRLSRQILRPVRLSSLTYFPADTFLRRTSTALSQVGSFSLWAPGGASTVISGAMPAPSIGVPSGIRSTHPDSQAVPAKPGSLNALGLPLEPRVRVPTVLTCGRHISICTKPSPLLTARGPIRQTTGLVYGFSTGFSTRSWTRPKSSCPGPERNL